MSTKKPTAKEANIYAKEWVLYGDKSRAARKTFPKSKASKKNMNVIACRLHKSSAVQERIEEYQEIAKGLIDEEFAGDVEGLAKMLLKGANMGLKLKTDTQGNMVPTDLKGMVSAASELNRMNGNHAPEKRELTGKNGAPLNAAPTLTQDQALELLKKNGVDAQ